MEYVNGTFKIRVVCLNIFSNQISILTNYINVTDYKL